MGGESENINGFFIFMGNLRSSHFPGAFMPTYRRTVDIHLFLMSTLPPTHSHFVLWRSRYNFFPVSHAFLFLPFPSFPLKKVLLILIDWLWDSSFPGWKEALPPSSSSSSFTAKPTQLSPPPSHHIFRRKKRKREIVQLLKICGKFKNAGFRKKVKGTFTTFKYFRNSPSAELDTEFSF